MNAMVLTSLADLHVYRRLYAGANADLFLAYGPGGEGPVIVKCLRDYRNPVARRIFSNQVRVLAHAHPGAIPLLLAGPKAPRPHYVMPYMSRGSLAQYAGALSAAQVRFVASRLARTLASMHARLDVHGDVKPDNVLVDGKGQIHLSDPLGNPMFLLDVITPNRGGTRGYWAPEVRAGGSVSSVGDVYSFGATLWHLVTGCRPTDDVEVGPDTGRFTNDGQLCDLISSCCRQSPAERPSMNDVAKILAGERWTDIRARRDLARAGIVAAIGVGVALWYVQNADRDSAA